MVRTRKNALCKLRGMYKAKKLKEIVSWTVILIHSLSSLLNVDTTRYLASIVRNSKLEPKGRMWNMKVFACLYPKV
jgi:hypothetical protein